MADFRHRRALAWALGLAPCAAASPACASGPEQIEQIEPEGGIWQIEVSLLSSHGEAPDPSFQMLYGLSDAVAIGVEIEGDGGNVESFAPTFLYRFGDASPGLALGAMGQIEFNTSAEHVAAEARLLIERQSRRWWGQGNVIVNAEFRDGRSESTLGYGWRISRALGNRLWLGGEGSGQLARLSGLTTAERGHYVGPAVTIAHELRSGAEIEFNASFLQRIAGEGPRGTLVLSAQVGL